MRCTVSCFDYNTKESIQAMIYIIYLVIEQFINKCMTIITCRKLLAPQLPGPYFLPHLNFLKTSIFFNINLNTLKHNWPILGQKKTSLVVFIWKRTTSLVVFFGNDIISNGLYQVIRNNIVAKKTAELVLLSYEKLFKLLSRWSNMG